jgi:hypothetical protein
MSLSKLRSRTRQVVVGTGRFYCPSCLNERPYTEKRTVKDYYILFLIPLGGSEPTDEVVIECQECQQTYTPEVFSLPENSAVAQAGQLDYFPKTRKKGDRP